MEAQERVKRKIEGQSQGSSAMNPEQRKRAIVEHVARQWPASELELFSWSLGGITQSMPDFVVCRAAPSGDTGSWVYVSIGASAFLNARGEHLQFSLLSPFETAENVETLAMVAHFHSDPSLRLELGRMIEIGRGWIENSKCDHLLVSLPYFKGQEFEDCAVSGHTMRILWLVPITAHAGEARSLHET